MRFVIDGIAIDLVEGSDRNVLHLLNNGYEVESLIVWARMIKPDTTVLDIGAYTGLYSIIAARRGARVIAFEPMPANRWRLGVNMKRNKVDFQILAVAVSDREGPATLHYNPRVPLTTGASLEENKPMHGAGIVVPCIMIDSLGLENVSAIKLDVERHEPCVIHGAMRTIKQCRPPMLVETLDGDMRKQVLASLPSYEAAAVLDGRNTLFTPRTKPCRKDQSQEPPS